MRLTYLLPCLALVGNQAWAMTAGWTRAEVNGPDGRQAEYADYSDYPGSTNTDEAIGNIDDRSQPGFRSTVSALSSIKSPGSLALVSVDMSASRSIGGTNASSASANWMSNFVNDTGSASEFLVTVSTDYWHSASVIDPDVPDGWTLSGTPPAYDLAGSIWLSLGTGRSDGTGISLKSFEPGLHSFSLGVLQPDESVLLSLSAYGDALAMVFTQTLCPVGSTDPTTCSNVWQSVSTRYGGSVSLVSVAAVPEPSTYLLTGMGLLAATLIARRRSP